MQGVPPARLQIEQLQQQLLLHRFPNVRGIKGSLVSTGFLPRKQRSHWNTVLTVHCASCTLHTPAAQQKAAGLNPIHLSPLLSSGAADNLGKFSSCGISIHEDSS